MRGGGRRKQLQRWCLKYGSWGADLQAGESPATELGWAALTLGEDGPVDIAENASRFRACDLRVLKCGGEVLWAPMWPQGNPKGPQPRNAPGPLPRPCTPPGPSTQSPSSRPQRPAAEGLGAIRGLAAQLQADPAWEV